MQCSIISMCVLLGYSSCMSLKAWTKETEELVLSFLRSPDVYEKEEGGTIAALAQSLGMTDYLKYIQKAGLMSELQSTGPYTAFGPTNEAIQALPPYLMGLLENRTSCENIMKYSVMKGKVATSEIKDNMMMPTLLGGESKMRFNVYKGGKVITASGRVIKMPGQTASNGMLYQMMGLPQPPLPPMAASLAQCPKYKTLTKAIEDAGMKSTLMGAGPFTMFAPTDAAFSKIPDATRHALLGNTTALKQLLMYHIVDGAFYTPAWNMEDTVTTKSGQTLTVKGNNGKWTVNTVPMIYPDTTTTNGVVHPIESVLMPPSAHVELVF